MGVKEDINIAIHAINENGQDLAGLQATTNEDKFSNKYFSENFTTAQKADLKVKYEELRLVAIAAADSLPILP